MFQVIPRDPKFYLVCLICVTFYCAVFPFISLGQAYFIRKFGFSMTEANAINGNISLNVWLNFSFIFISYVLVIPYMQLL